MFDPSDNLINYAEQDRYLISLYDFSICQLYIFIHFHFLTYIVKKTANIFININRYLLCSLKK